VRPITLTTVRSIHLNNSSRQNPSTTNRSVPLSLRRGKKESHTKKIVDGVRSITLTTVRPITLISIVTTCIFLSLPISIHNKLSAPLSLRRGKKESHTKKIVDGVRSIHINISSRQNPSTTNSPPPSPLGEGRKNLTLKRLLMG